MLAVIAKVSQLNIPPAFHFQLFSFKSTKKQKCAPTLFREKSSVRNRRAAAAAAAGDGHAARPTAAAGIGHRAWASATPCRRLRSVLPGRSSRASGGRAPPRRGGGEGAAGTRLGNHEPDLRGNVLGGGGGWIGGGGDGDVSVHLFWGLLPHRRRTRGDV